MRESPILMNGPMVAVGGVARKLQRLSDQRGYGPRYPYGHHIGRLEVSVAVSQGHVPMGDGQSIDRPRTDPAFHAWKRDLGGHEPNSKPPVSKLLSNGVTHA